MNSAREQISARLRSFGYAFSGIGFALKTQPNTWIHAVVTTFCVLLALWLRLPARDWAVLLLAMMAVWGSELLNTAVEALVDMTTPDPHPLAKAAKDVAAGAVLLVAIGAALVGLLILGPPLWRVIS